MFLWDIDSGEIHHSFEIDDFEKISQHYHLHQNGMIANDDICLLLKSSDSSEYCRIEHCDSDWNKIWRQEFPLADVFEQKIKAVECHKHNFIVILEGFTGVYLIPQLGSSGEHISGKPHEKLNAKDIKPILLEGDDRGGKIYLWQSTSTKLMFIVERDNEKLLKIFDFTPSYC